MSETPKTCGTCAHGEKMSTDEPCRSCMHIHNEQPDYWEPLPSPAAPEAPRESWPQGKCACTHEAGDSPCPVHGLNEAETYQACGACGGKGIVPMLAPSPVETGAMPGVFRDARRAWSALALELPEQVHDDAGRVILAAISEGERLSAAPSGATDGDGAMLDELEREVAKMNPAIEDSSIDVLTADLRRLLSLARREAELAPQIMRALRGEGDDAAKADAAYRIAYAAHHGAPAPASAPPPEPGELSEADVSTIEHADCALALALLPRLIADWRRLRARGNGTRDCRSCAHARVGLLREPCRSCWFEGGFPRWSGAGEQPASPPAREATRICGTCRHWRRWPDRDQGYPGLPSAPGSCCSGQDPQIAACESDSCSTGHWEPLQPPAREGQGSGTKEGE